LQFGSVGTDGRTVALQKLATLSLSADAALPQCCVAQHVPDRHPGRLQTAEKLDPGQDRCVVIPMARLVAVSIGQQPDPLIVTNRMCCQSRAFRQFTNLHEHPYRSTTQRKLGVRARSKSRGNRITVIRAPARCLRRGGASLRFGTGKWTNKVCSPLVAGIWTEFKGGTKSKPVPGPHLVYGFLTTTPNAVLEPVHPKAMPVILTTDEERDVWMRAP
jgi:hypothetical protein